MNIKNICPFKTNLSFYKSDFTINKIVKRINKLKEFGHFKYLQPH